ncbi:hypothetical protein ACHQM5_004543 [Ranunculus cassubicifolius]
MYQLVIFIISGVFIIRSSGYCSRRTSNCGQTQIDWPFWTVNYGDERCNGYPGFQIGCSKDGNPIMNISNNPYIVQNIDSARIYVLDMDLDGKQCPRPRRNFSIDSDPFLQFASEDRKITVFYNCTNPPKDVAQNLPCLDNGRSFAFLEGDIPRGFDWYGNCEESVVTWMSIAGSTGDQTSTDVNYTQRLLYGLPLKYSTPVLCVNCEESGGQCLINPKVSGFKCLCADGSEVANDICSLGVLAGVGAIVLIVLLIFRKTLYTLYTILKDRIRDPTHVDMFLENYGSLSLQRFRYSDIKKMTNSFTDRLGQGGYGSVFKGKLNDGRLVAVKLLNGAKGNGEEFTNEVATIGRTNHVNVVSLLGFSTDGSKRALVYEYMANGSLEKFIYHERRQDPAPNPLGWEELYQIALGIARGLDYLHRGCNTRILHMDIKPHNILLDQDFCPKISDFGLAKLCTTKDSIVSMRLPRGTVGYIAPEVYSRKYQNASHKSDVYSYGMMVLEMIGGRQNVDSTAANSVEAYLPQCIYTRLEQDFTVEESEKIFTEETTRRMIIVALWCIQTHPTDRPPISKVVEMLEGNIVEEMPPNPFLSFPFGSRPGSPMSKSTSVESRNEISKSVMEGR